MKNSFSARVLRLKEQLQEHTDKDVGSLLGLSDKAFSARKTRDSFPEKELYALVAKRPDLGLDVEYVLNGVRNDELVAMIGGLGSRIAKLRGSSDVASFAKRVGTDPQTLMAVESGQIAPTTNLIQSIITTHPELDVMWLLSGQETQLEGALSSKEKVMVTNYRAASSEGKKALEVQAAFFAKNNEGTAALAAKSSKKGGEK